MPESAPAVPGRAGRRNAIVIISDAKILPAAKFLWWKLRKLRDRDDTDIVLIAPEPIGCVLDETPAPGEARRLADFPVPDVPVFGRGHVSSTTFNRIAVPAAMQAEYRRILYMDVDVYPCDRRVFALFDLPLETAIAAALDGPVMFHPEHRHGALVGVRKMRFERYFNAGVLLVDTDRWARSRIECRTWDTVRAYGRALGHAEQTALNIAVPHEISNLSPTFNFWVDFLGSAVETRFPPSLVHYYGRWKAWQRPNRHRRAWDREIRNFLIRTGEWRFLWNNTFPSRYRTPANWPSRWKGRAINEPENNRYLAAYFRETFIDEHLIGS